MEIILLASGSTGNCALIRAGQGTDQVVVALDCGIAQRTGRQRAMDVGLSLTSVDAVLLSHAHSDHSKNVVAVAARAEAPLYAHKLVPDQRRHSGEAERKRRKVELRPFLADQSFDIGPLKVTPIELPHDAVPTHGFIFEADGQKAGFFTDLGTTVPLADGVLDGMESLVLEFNYCPEMLRNGPYPRILQHRISAGLGHISNHQAADLLRECCPKSLRRLTLAHLSKKNNRPALALQVATDALREIGRLDIKIEAAPPHHTRRAGPDPVELNYENKL
ncbi:MAG: MBL fold metallo-hydrolase [Planctomycetes bacterium]|nr:MBL fold metallo-hydrolase [Planctomycetota bacterium]